MQFSKAKTDFLEYLGDRARPFAKDYSKLRSYLTRLVDFTGDLKVSEIDGELVRKWRLWLNRIGSYDNDELQKSTLNYHLIALRSFLNFVQNEEINAMSADKIELAKSKRKQVTFLTSEEIERLFAGPDLQKEQGLRDRSILELLFSSGLRVSELVGLDKDHVNLKRREFSVRGKGQKIDQYS